MARAPRLFPGPAKRTDLQEIANQTERAIRLILLIALAVMAAINISGLVTGGGVRFVIWAFVGSLSALTVGGAVGLLFGLPTAQSRSTQVAAAQALAATATPVTPVQQANSPTTPAPMAGPAPPPTVLAPSQQTEVPDLNTGYRDSTSLEQIADWLTKIIVGLTLTQFASWEVRFDTLARSMTEAMIGAPGRTAECLAAVSSLSGAVRIAALSSALCQAPAPSAVPGGVLVALFATAGFLISYLWMRRYFILEMVIARKSAIDLLTIRNAETRTNVAAQNEAQILSELAAARSESEKLKAQSDKLLTELEVSRAQEAARMAEAEKNRLAAEKQGRAQTTSERRNVGDNWPLGILRKAQSLLPAESHGLAALAQVQKALEEDLDPEDPWRNKFGGQATSGGKALEASVSTTANPEIFLVELAVRVLTEPLPEDLVGDKVVFFLHPTFGDDPRVSSVGADGKAPLVLYAYGAFTTGVVLEDGTTLELNLATLEDAPVDFRSR
jgi:hypothetical protein